MLIAMSTFWIYIRIQLMMFVFGIVGPIFLLLYFAIQPDTTIKWMYWWGLFITAADIFIALIITSGTKKEPHDGAKVKGVRLTKSENE